LGRPTDTTRWEFVAVSPTLGEAYWLDRHPAVRGVGDTLQVWYRLEHRMPSIPLRWPIVLSRLPASVAVFRSRVVCGRGRFDADRFADEYVAVNGGLEGLAEHAIAPAWSEAALDTALGHVLEAACLNTLGAPK
jgi:hypothetical protein